MSWRWDRCLKCGVGIWLTDEQYDCLVRSHQTYYCIWGHGQHFTHDVGETALLRQERDRLKQEQARLIEERDAALRRAEAQRERARHNLKSARAYKGVATKMKRRAAVGVCPCCSRTFRQLAAHMRSQHPHYADEAMVTKDVEVAK